MKVEIIDIEKKKDSEEYYIVFDYLGKLRRTLITKRVKNYFNIDDFFIGDKIEVLKSISSQGKDFYKIIKIYDN